MRKSSFTLFLGFACLVLSVQVVVLSVQNRRLKAVVEAHAAEPPPTGMRFAVGDVVGEIPLFGNDGTPERLAFEGDGGRALVLVFAEGCSACPRIYADWEELALHFAAEGTRVVPIQLDRAEPAGRRAFGAPVHAPGTLDPATLSRLTAVPLTLLVDARGVVEWVHYGSFVEGRKEELASFLADTR